MARQITCANCPNNFGVSTLGSHSTGINQGPTLETRLQNVPMRWSNPDTRTEEIRPVMEVLKKSMTKYFTEPVLVLPPYNVSHLQKIIHGFPRSVEDMIKQIDNKDPSEMSDAEKTKEKKFIETWNTDKIAKFAEDAVANQLCKIAKERGEECVIFTGYNSSSYLSILREKAKSARTSSLEPINQYENIIIDCLAFDIRVDKEAADIMAALTSSSMESKDMNNTSINAIIKNIPYGKKLRETLQSTFKKKSNLLQADLINILRYSKFTSSLEGSSMEVDVLAHFPHQKKILQVEIKSANKQANVLSKLKDASKQCTKFEDYVDKVHGDILPPGTTYYKVAAFPQLDNQTDLSPKPGTNQQPPCASCLEFIWTRQEIEKMEVWLQTHIFTCQTSQTTPTGHQDLCTRLGGFLRHIFTCQTSQTTPTCQTSQTTPTGHQDLCTRLGGFLSISPQQPQFFMSDLEATLKYDAALVGEDHEKVTAEGSSQADQNVVMTRDGVKNMKLSDLKNKALPLSSLELFLTWNQDQLDILLREDPRLCLPSDFGTGKSLLEKEMARRKAEKLSREGSTDKSVFVSLAAAQDYEYGCDWMEDTVFDIATRAEFANSGVVFYSVADLVNELTTPQERNHILTVEILMERLVTKYPNYHFYFDEVPVGSRFDFQFPHMPNAWTVSSGTLVLALRPTYVGSSEQSQYDADFAAFKSALVSSNVAFPSLTKAMRNTENVSKLADTAQESGTNSSTASSLPANTVTGTVPNLVITRDKKDTLTSGVKYAIDKLYRGQPVVVLVRKPSDVDAVVGSCRGAGYTTRGYGGPHHSTRADVEAFLQSPQGVLVTTGHHFNGCQFRNIVLCTEDSTADDRGGVMRARVSATIIADTGDPQLDEMKEICQIYDISN